MTRLSLPDDFLGRRIIRALLILQLAALLPVGIISFTRYASIALFIAFLLFLILLSVFAWLYSRYQASTIVKQKRRLQQELGRLKTQIQTEDAHIKRGRVVRDQLSQSV